MTTGITGKPELILKMREYGKKGKSIKEIVELIRMNEMPFNSFVVCKYFMLAFNLTFTEIKNLPGASYVDGSFSEQLIEDTVGCAVRNGRY